LNRENGLGEALLTAECISKVVEEIQLSWNECIYTPLVTLWVFLGQVLSADPSCTAAVARLIAHRVARGLKACSAETGAYCLARKRLPERFFSAIAFLVGRNLDTRVDSHWLWKGRRVYLYDGSTVSMPDTEANRKEYPLTYNRKPGTAFPVARLGALISLSCGAILNLGICRYAGKGQSELGMLHNLWDVLRQGDILVADRLMCAWTEMVMLQQRGIDCVFRLTSHRTADFRLGTRLGKDDHIVKWVKPQKPRSIDRKTYDALPEFLLVRECRVRISQSGFRFRTLVIATTLLNADEYTKDDLAQVYRARWNEELDLRSIKTTMQMDMLRCMAPEQVRKEIWTHVLAYNLIRTIMAQAASEHGIAPRTVSFKGIIQVLEAFQPVIAQQADRGVEHQDTLYQQLLHAIAQHRVADRPDRFEPRMTKRKPKSYDRLTRPRQVIKREILQRDTKS
jgi:Transposase DDE domain